MSAFLSKMFDVGDLPVGLLTFGNCVLKAEWLNGLWNYSTFFRFLRFFKIQKTWLFTFFELLHTFSRTLIVNVYTDRYTCKTRTSLHGGRAARCSVTKRACPLGERDASDGRDCCSLKRAGGPRRRIHPLVELNIRRRPSSPVALDAAFLIYIHSFIE